MVHKVTGNICLSDEKVGELQNQIGVYYNNAIGYAQGELGVRTRTAWDYYYGKLPEPVTKGSSKWVDRTVWETVNGTLQELISVFTSGEDAVRFSPMHSADADAARAATKMVNQILLRDNDGYNVLHDAFKECLVARNSFIKRYWKEETHTFNEEFEAMSQEELDIYLMNLEGEIVEMTTELDPTPDDEDEEDSPETYSGRVRYEVKKENVRVEYVPFEQVLVEPTATSIKDCNYIAHRVRKTKDELLQMGFDEEVVKTIRSATSDIETGVIANARVNNMVPMNVNDALQIGDEKADKVWLHEHYIKTSLVDGTYEILQVFTVHNQILEVNQVNEFPFETMTPFPTPGSLWGESVYDITKDIQDLLTSLIRGTIDNIQNANFRRYQAVKGGYDRASLLDNRPGGVIEVQSIGAVSEFDHRSLPPGVNDLIMLIDAKKEERTGVSKVGQGLDPAVFKNDNSTATVNMVMTAAQNRLRMVARNVAHRGMMSLMLSIYNLVRMNGKDLIRIETAKGEITIDPRTLPPRNEMIVAVAVGDGERKERAANLQNVLMVMTQVPQMQQFLQPHNAYYMAVQMMESVGIYDTENFITPLDQIPPPQPDPMQELQMATLQEQLKKLQADTQKVVADVQDTTMKSQFEQMRAADEFNMRREESLSNQDSLADKMNMEQSKMSIDQQKVELERMRVEIEKMRVQGELELKQQQLRLKEQELLLEAQLEQTLGRPVGLGRS